MISQTAVDQIRWRQVGPLSDLRNQSDEKSVYNLEVVEYPIHFILNMIELSKEQLLVSLPCDKLQKLLLAIKCKEIVF